MPDLQTALSTVAKQIRFDDVDEVQETPMPVSHQLFYWYVNNPNSSPREAQEALDSEAKTSISSRTNQMWKKGLLSRNHDDGVYRYTATCTEYPKFTTEMRQKQMAKAIAAKKKKPKAVKALSKPTPTASLNKSPDAEQIVNSMSVGLAKAVYLELKKVFEA